MCVPNPAALGPGSAAPARSLAWPCGLGDVEGETPHGSSHLIGVGDPLAIEPDLRAIVDSLEVERDRSSRHLRRQVELGPKPPADREWVVLGRARPASSPAATPAHARPVAKFVPKNGSGYTPACASTPETVAGTAVGYHPLAANPAFEMAAPSGWPLDVCTCQPSRSISRAPQATLWAEPPLVFAFALRLWPCSKPASCTPLRELHEANATNAALATSNRIRVLLIGFLIVVSGGDF